MTFTKTASMSYLKLRLTFSVMALTPRRRFLTTHPLCQGPYKNHNNLHLQIRFKTKTAATHPRTNPANTKRHEGTDKFDQAT